MIHMEAKIIIGTRLSGSLISGQKMARYIYIYYLPRFPHTLHCLCLAPALCATHQTAVMLCDLHGQDWNSNALVISFSQLVKQCWCCNNSQFAWCLHLFVVRLWVLMIYLSECSLKFLSVWINLLPGSVFFWMCFEYSLGNVHIACVCARVHTYTHTHTLAHTYTHTHARATHWEFYLV